MKHNIALLIALLLALTACGDTTDDPGGDSDNNAVNNDQNNDVNNDGNNDINNDVNNDQNNDVNNDQNNDQNNDAGDIQACQDACTQVAGCQELIDACGEDVVAQALTQCQGLCEQDPQARAQITRAGAAPCSVVTPIVIEQFGLGDLCGGDGPECEVSEDCPQPPPIGPQCEGNTVVTVAGAVCNDGTCGIETLETDCADDGLVCRSGECVEDDGNDVTPAAAGDIVITEIMYNPTTIGDDDGEYIELHNTAPGRRSLADCTLSDSNPDNTPVPLTDIAIGAGQYIILAHNQDPSFFGGVAPAGIFDFGLNNDGDIITLTCGGQVFDIVLYDAGDSFPEASGTSLNLSSDALDAEDNDESANWCLSTNIYVQDNAGTPAAANRSCGAPPDDGVCELTPEEVIEAAGTFTGSNADTDDTFFSLECGDEEEGIDGGDTLYTIIPPIDTTICVNTAGSEELTGDTDTLIYVRSACQDNATEITCNDDYDINLDSAIEWEATAGTPYYLIIDSYDAFSSNDFQFTVDFEACPPPELEE